MIQTRKHSPAIDSFLLGSTREMFVDLENELVLTHSQLLVSLIWKITSFMCGGEHLKSMFPIYDLYVWEYVKHKESTQVDLFDILNVLDFFFFSLKGLFMNCPVWEQFIILCACYIIRPDGYRLWKPGSNEEIIVSNPF